MALQKSSNSVEIITGTLLAMAPVADCVLLAGVAYLARRVGRGCRPHLPATDGGGAVVKVETELRHVVATAPSSAQAGQRAGESHLKLHATSGRRRSRRRRRSPPHIFR